MENENQSLKQEVQNLKDAILVQKKIEAALTKNISSLFLTAKAEVARKDRQIAKLTETVDNMYFRRKVMKPVDSSMKASDTRTEVITTNIKTEPLEPNNIVKGIY